MAFTHRFLGDEFTVNTKTSDDQQIPRVAALPSGGYVIVWNDVVARDAMGVITDLDVRAQRFDADGNKVGPETVVNSSTAGLQGQGYVTALTSGGYVVGWTDSSGGTNDVRAQIFDSSGTAVGSSFLLNTDTTGSEIQPAITALPSGGFVATWRSASTSHPDSYDIKAQVFDAAGMKLGGEVLVVTVPSVQQTDATVTTLTSGRFVVTWTEATGTTTGFLVPANVKAQIFEANGTKVGSEFTVNPDTVDTQARPVIAALASGGFVVAWQDISGQGGDASEYSIRAQLFDGSGAKVGGAFLVNTSTANTQELPRIASLASGGFVVSWADESGDGSGSGVKAQIFDANGAKRGAEFLVNTATVNDQLFSTLVETASGRLVAAWDDASQVGGDPTGFGVKARHIALYTSDPIVGTAGADTINGTSHNDVIEAGDGADVVSALAGDDILLGGAGNDFLNGGDGRDLMKGGAGSDTYYVDSADDEVVELAGEGEDRVASSVSYVLDPGVEVEILEVVTLGTTNALNFTGNEFNNVLIGNNGANVLDGAAGLDVLIGLGGDDLLIGNSGSDEMYGGAGNDTYYVDSPNDQVIESAGEGQDRVATSSSFALRADSEVEILEAITLTDTTPINLTGSRSNNFIIGNDGANIIDGGGGNDNLFGLGGDDIFIGSTSANAFFGGRGNDTFYVRDSGDAVIEAAGEGTDRIALSVSYVLAADSEVEVLEAVNLSSVNAMDITGSNSANTIVGNNGDNVLDGKGGSDVLVGANGSDTFQFTAALGPDNVDRIEDFQSGVDRIALDDAVFTGLTPGPLPAGAFVAGASAQDADDRIIYNTQTGALLFDADGTGSGAAVQFASVQPGTTILSSDILVI